MLFPSLREEVDHHLAVRSLEFGMESHVWRAMRPGKRLGAGVTPGQQAGMKPIKEEVASVESAAGS